MAKKKKEVPKERLFPDPIFTVEQGIAELNRLELAFLGGSTYNSVKEEMLAIDDDSPEEDIEDLGMHDNG